MFESDPGQPARSPAIIRTGDPVIGAPTERAGEQLARLVHDLRNLIDGSHRQVNLTLRSVKDAVDLRDEQEEILRRLRTVRTALEQMAVMAAEAGGRHDPARLATQGFRRSMAEAVRHAAWILEPKAAKHKVTLAIELVEVFDQMPAGAMYTVVLNAVQNAIDAVRATGRGEGSIRVVGTLQKLAWAERLCIEVIDDGVGPPAGLECFQHGVTSKRGHLGIGLSMAAEIVTEADGMITLEARHDGAGAVLRVLLPIKKPTGEEGSAS